MSESTAAVLGVELGPKDRLEVLFDRLSELTGQRNAIDAQIVDIATEIHHHELWGMTGCRSLSAVIAWKTGSSPRNADTVAAIAERADQFPLCMDDLREGRLSLDQVGVIAERAADGSDAHYAELAANATVTQLRTAIKLAPHPDPTPAPEPRREITRHDCDDHTTWRITLPHAEAAVVDAALQSHLDALITQWTRDHPDDTPAEGRPPMPTQADAFLHLIEAGWDTDVAARPHGQRSTVVVHLDVEKKMANLHLGPLLSDADRHYLTCDATAEVWFQRGGRVIGCGRATRTVNRRLRRALEHRDTTCVVPGCGATRALHAHHLIHWEDGGPTELWNLVLVCPFHHRAHHRGQLTLTGPAEHLVVTDTDGNPMTNASLARPPTTPPPDVPPYRGPTGERAHWWWYNPYQPQPPPSLN